MKALFYGVPAFMLGLGYEGLGVYLMLSIQTAHGGWRGTDGHTYKIVQVR